MEEQEAIARLKQGDIKGLEILVRTYQLPATRVAYLITRDRALAEEIVQSAFLRAYERIGQFSAGRSFGPWFLRSVVNEAVKCASKGNRLISLDADESEEDSSLSDTLTDPAPGPEELAETEEVRRIVWDALGKLPPKQRAVIVMRYYLGLSEAEMGQCLGCPAGTVKWRLHAARQRLQELLHPLWTGLETGR
ncbi:MAG: sigma-70 family RNA polymerase sigma factor [Anaerolineae bacterium]|nr:sigma-70 family RNA polymerase sigma factor [Anaerolineae bacterium]